MKKLFILFITQLFVFVAFSQSQSDSNYSLGLKFMSIEEFPKFLNEVRINPKLNNTTFNGLIFKVNDNQISYRFQVSNFKNNDFTFDNECADCEVVRGKFTDLNLKMGFEKNLNYTRLQPFYGLDFGYRRITFVGEAKNTGTSAFLYHANINKHGATIYPFLGLKFNIIKAITISAESGIDFLFTSDKEIKSTNNNAVQSVNNFTRWQIASKPLGMLSLQFNFCEN
jgi:hypothetical protein